MAKPVPLLHDDLVFIDYQAKDRKDLLTNLSQVLIEKGYVNSKYTKGILEREQNFPTGLPTSGVKVAIPHTDPQYVNVPAILIAKLKYPIIFKEMGNGDNELPISLIFMLALKSHDSQIDMLSKFMKILSDGDSLKMLYNAKTPKEMIEKLNSLFV